MRAARMRTAGRMSDTAMNRLPTIRSIGAYVRWFCIAAAAAAVVGYILFQARYLLGGPALALEAEPEPVQASSTVVISGTARNIASLTLNGRQIYTTETGFFKELVVLETGYTIMTLEASDRYGKKSRLERTFVHLPE